MSAPSVLFQAKGVACGSPSFCDAAAPIEATAYWKCLDRQATRLERTGEQPRDVALAALDLCTNASRDFAAERGYGPALMLRIHKRLVQKVTARVVQLRAKGRGF